MLLLGSIFLAMTAVVATSTIIRCWAGQSLMNHCRALVFFNFAVVATAIAFSSAFGQTTTEQLIAQAASTASHVKVVEYSAEFFECDGSIESVDLANPSFAKRKIVGGEVVYDRSRGRFVGRNLQLSIPGRDYKDAVYESRFDGDKEFRILDADGRKVLADDLNPLLARLGLEKPLGDGLAPILTMKRFVPFETMLVELAWKSGSKPFSIASRSDWPGESFNEVEIELSPSHGYAIKQIDQWVVSPKGMFPLSKLVVIDYHEFAQGFFIPVEFASQTVGRNSFTLTRIEKDSLVVSNNSDRYSFDFPLTAEWLSPEVDRRRRK